MPVRRPPLVPTRPARGPALALALALALGASLLGGVARAADPADLSPVRLDFGVYSANKPSAMVRVFKPVLHELERRMSDRLARDVDIRMQIARDYEQGIADLVEGRVDVSHFGPASYIEAKRMNGDIRIVAMENENDSRVFYGIIAVAADSDIRSVEDLRGRSFAFGDEGSTIGRFLSQLYLERHGIHAADLSRYEYLGRHDRVGTAVGAGDFAAGALNEKTFKKLVAADENLRELARFPNVTKPWISRSGLEPEIFDALQASLLEIDDPATLAELKIDGFLTGSDADYDDIRQAIDDNDAFFAEPPARGAIAAAEAAEVETRAEAAPPSLGAAGPAGSAVRDARHLTLNIVLPAALFAVDGERPSELTINLRVPPSGTGALDATLR